MSIYDALRRYEFLVRVFTVCTILSLSLVLSPDKADAADTVVFLTTTSVTSWTVPSDFTAVNTIEVIGGGAGGGSNGSFTYDGAGGGGGGYSKITNLSLTPGGSATYRAGAAGAAESVGADTFFNRTAGSANTCADTSSVCAKGGGAGTSAAGAGGADTAGIGTVKYSGGAGHTGNGGGGGGGGGAAGLNGAGLEGSGASGGAGGAGGAGDNGSGGAGGGSSSNGGNGTEWDATHGSGGGAGGGSFDTGAGSAGFTGGRYGGAGSGAAVCCDVGTGGTGHQGVIVITYTPGAAGTASGTTMLMAMVFFLKPVPKKQEL